MRIVGAKHVADRLSGRREASLLDRPSVDPEPARVARAGFCDRALAREPDLGAIELGVGPASRGLRACNGRDYWAAPGEIESNSVAAQMVASFWIDIFSYP